MKKQIIVLMAIMMIGVAVAGVTLLDKATFTPKPVDANTRQEGIITFDCDGKGMQLYLDEPDMNIDDDFEYEVAKLCGKEVTNARDWTSRDFKEKVIGGETKRSFNETKLNVLALAAIK